MRKVVVMALLIAIFCSVNGDTDPTDASTLNSLFTSLNSLQQLTKWKPSGGDPCGESWKGITCSGPRVTEINIAGLGLTGNMGYLLNKLTSVTSFDISNNQLGNQIPLQLPPNVQKLNLAGNGFVASLPMSLSQMASLKYLNVSHNQIEGPITISFAALTSLSTLDLSFNGMTGNLPESFQSLKSVTDMYLQNNQFAGTIDVLANLPLENLNIENNGFSGWIPERLKSINLQSKGNLFNSSPAPPAPPGTPPATEPHQNHKSGGNSVSSKSTSRKSGIAAIAIIAGIVILALILAAILAFIMIKRQRRSRKSPPDTKKLDDLPFTPPPQVQEMMSVENSLKNSSKSSKAPILRPQPVDRHKGFETDNISLQPIVAPKKVNRAPINVKHYSVADLQIATDSFCVENFIGEGSVGPVYRAHLDNGQVVAVKKINSSSVSNSEDFLDIVSDISRLHHPNISELVGYCCEHGQHLLVYEFHKNGSLYENLYFSDEYSKPLTWNSRVKIAIGAAKGLEYIHEACSPPSIHQNFKSDNILLDAQLNAHITDYGLAPLVRPDQVPGYSAPEVATSGRYTVKSDVYSFGIVMLELLTGRKPFDSSRARSEQSLVRWATPQLHDIDALTKMVDPALNGLFPVKSLSYFADIIALCVQPEPEFRPPMSEVVESLVRLVQRASMSRRTLGGDSLSRRESITDVERYISP